MTKVYLDACCLNRPFDDQTQDRVRLEAEAVLLILTHLEAGEWQWIGSEVLEYEIDQTPDPDRNDRLKLMTSSVRDIVRLEQTDLARAQQLEARGFWFFWK